MRKKLGNGCRRKEFNSPFQFLQKLVSPLQYRLTVLRFDAQALVDLGEVVHFYGRKENPKEECQNYPAVPQIVLLQTFYFLHCRLSGSRNIQTTNLRT